jgi:hypothetical protein
MSPQHHFQPHLNHHQLVWQLDQALSLIYHMIQISDLSDDDGKNVYPAPPQPTTIHPLTVRATLLS